MDVTLRPILSDLITYGLGIACGFWLAGRWGAGAIAGLFCAARIYSARIGVPHGQ
jgi:hypothetical protein